MTGNNLRSDYVANSGGSAQSDDDVSFEGMFKELQSIILTIENRKELGIGEILTKAERGVELYKRCVDDLKDAEARLAALRRELEHVDGDRK